MMTLARTPRTRKPSRNTIAVAYRTFAEEARAERDLYMDDRDGRRMLRYPVTMDRSGQAEAIRSVRSAWLSSPVALARIAHQRARGEARARATMVLFGGRTPDETHAPARPKRTRKPRAKVTPAPAQEVPPVDLATVVVDVLPPVACATVTTADVQRAIEAGNDRLVIVTPPARMPRPDPTARFLAARALVQARADLAQRQAPGPVASRLISDRAVDRLARLRRAAGRCGADRKVIMSTSGAVATTAPPSPPRGRFEPEAPASDARTDAGLAGEMVTIEGRQYRMTSYGETAGRRGYCLEYGTTAHDVEERADGRVVCTCPSFVHRCAILPGAVCKHGEYLISRGLLAQRTPTPEPDPDPTPGRPEADPVADVLPALPADFALPALCGGSGEADTMEVEDTPVTYAPDALERAEDYVLRLEMELAAARREVERLRGLAVADGSSMKGGA